MRPIRTGDFERIQTAFELAGQVLALGKPLVAAGTQAQTHVSRLRRHQGKPRGEALGAAVLSGPPSSLTLLLRVFPVPSSFPQHTRQLERMLPLTSFGRLEGLPTLPLKWRNKAHPGVSLQSG